MEDLIKALQIFAKYDKPYYPTHCEHDMLYVMIDPDIVSDEDKVVLEQLGFVEEDAAFVSYKFGSA